MKKGRNSKSIHHSESHNHRQASHAMAVIFISLAAIAVGVGFSQMTGAVTGSLTAAGSLGIIAIVASLLALAFIALKLKHSNKRR